jgi:hypothetical protein
MTDKQIDDLLKEIERHAWEVTSFNKEIDGENFKLENIIETFNKSIHISYLMEELGLIRFIQVIKETNFYGFTKKGRKVVRLGGWLKYLERQDKIEKRKEKKENAELKITEFQARNQNLPYIVSISGVIISIVALIINCSSNDGELTQEKEHTMEYKLEKTKSKTKKNLGLDTLLIERK